MRMAAAVRALHRLPPETAHDLSLWALRTGLVPAQRITPHPSLAVTVWDKHFSSPVGLAAGFDKNARALAPLLALGFSFVEAGTVTPRPQAGNPKPRLFRLREDRAIINRMGFNNEGLDAFVARVRAFRARGTGGIVGLNIGKNKDQADPVADYVAGVQAVAPFADYIVINISSPNTAGLRDLQHGAAMATLLRAVKGALLAQQPAGAPPLLVKLAPDLSEADLKEALDVAVDAGLSGVILTNTTVTRPASLRGRDKSESGGLSGAPLRDLSTRMLRLAHDYVQGALPLIAAGGVASAQDVYDKIRAGASLVQVYTGFVYEGPSLLRRIHDELPRLLAQDGIKTIAAARGVA